jgi:type II secretory pathway component GspD/PulD (secretin)
MKNTTDLIIAITALHVASMRAAESPAAPPGQTAPQAAVQPGQSAPKTVAPADVPKPATPEAVPPIPRQAPQSEPAAAAPADATSAAPSSDNETSFLHLNFRAASLDQVLNYFSEAAGYVINVKPGTSVRGKVDLWNSNPLTRAEALDLLDTVLIQNGLAAIRNGKTLTIVNKDEAKTQNIPVNQGGDPDKIPITDKVVTQIIPVRFVEVGQLVKDLQPLVSTQTTMTADEAGNSIVITDTQANIHKVAEIIRAIDMSAEDFTVLKVFRLSNADPTETADLLTSLFPDDSRSGSGSSQSPFAGGGGFRSRFFGGGGGGGGGGSSNSQNQRIKKRNKVIAVADQRTASVVVSANRDLMDQIADVVADLDGDPRKQMVTVIPAPHTDPDQLRQVMQDIFSGQNSANNRNQNQSGALQQRSNAQNQQNNSSSRTSMTGSTRGGGAAGGGFGQ